MILDMGLCPLNWTSLHGERESKGMNRIHRELKKISFIVNVVSVLTMARKQRYINVSDDQWEQLHWEFFNGCAFVWKHPVHIAAFLIWAPRLIKILSFFYPLLISTILLLLIIFTIGPQLERMKADSDLQWVRFKEAAAVGCEDDFGGSWAGQQPYSGLKISREVNGQEAKSTDDWAGWAESLHGCNQSIDQFQNSMEKNDIKFDYDKVTDDEAEQEGQLGVSSKSIILDKVRELMERLIDELGGRVEIDALNALESISQVLIESTWKDYEKQGKNCLISAMRETENDLSDNEQFLKNNYVGDSEFISRSVSVSAGDLDHVPFDHIEAAKADRKEGKNVGSFAMEEPQHKLLRQGEFPKTGNVGDSEFRTRPVTAGRLNAQTLEKAQKDPNDGRKQGKLYKLFISEDELSHNGKIKSSIDNARDNESIARTGTATETSMEQWDYPVPESLVEYSCSSSISDISLEPEKDNTSLRSVGAHISRPQEGRSPLVQDKHQKAIGLSVVQQYELRTRRSVLPGVIKDESRSVNELREAGDVFGKKTSVIGDGRHPNQPHSSMFSNEQHENCKSRKIYEKLLEDSSNNSSEFSTPIMIPEYQNKQHHVIAGKLRSVTSDPITFVKKPQLVASPVMLLGTQEMDLLWEEYNDAPKQEPAPSSNGHAADFNDDLSEMIDSDSESSTVCCLQALKLKGKLPLKKPNLKKISKALKKLGIMQHLRGRKTA